MLRRGIHEIVGGITRATIAGLAFLGEHSKEIMSFAIYLLGFLILIAGLSYGATLMHVPTRWIVSGAIALTGLGILTGVKGTRQRESK